VPPSIGATFTGELAAAAAGAASAESSLAGIGSACLPVASADLSHGRPAGRAATSAASAARSDSDDVHIVARLSALTLPPSAAQLPARLAAAAAAAAAGVTATAKVQAGSASPVAPGAAAAAAAASVVCGTASCGHSLVKDLESDSVNEKSPARPLSECSPAPAATDCLLARLPDTSFSTPVAACRQVLSCCHAYVDSVESWLGGWRVARWHVIHTAARNSFPLSSSARVN